MFEIKGKVSSATVFAAVVEEMAIEQIRRMCDHKFTKGSNIRIMPDVHAGKGCTIGTTMTVIDKVVPNIVGVDIGCGMYTVNLGDEELDYEKIDEAAHYIPSGMNVWESSCEQFDLERLKCYQELTNRDRLRRSLGTLGGGNHFIEIEEAADRTKYLVIHSGSRNLGKQVADYYQKVAIELNRANEGQGEIQSALEELRGAEGSPAVTEDLCYLYGSYLEDYLHDIEICQDFARRNREVMAKIIVDWVELTGAGGFHTIHNYIDIKEMILRKGAIAAHKGEKVLIPINMRDGSILAYGKGNANWNYSAPHGAGRLMSRSRAKADLDMEEYRRSMEGIYTTSVNYATLDEAPMAYKSLDDIIDVIKDSVDIIDVMKPVYNFKAAK